MTKRVGGADSTDTDYAGLDWSLLTSTVNIFISQKGRASQEQGVIRGLHAASLCTSRRYLQKTCRIFRRVLF